MREPAGGRGRNPPRGAARIAVRLVPAERERRRPLERDRRPVVRLAAWRRGRSWVASRRLAAAELSPGPGPEPPRLPGPPRARSGVLAWHPPPVWRYRPSPWARRRPLPWMRLRAPPWVRDPALPWRLPAWWRPGRPVGRGVVGRWDRDRWTWRQPGRPPPRGAWSTLGRPTGAGAHPSGGRRTGGWRPGRALAASPGLQRAGPGARPGPPGCRPPTRQGRRGGRGHRAVVRAWRHRPRGRRFPARRRAGRAGSRSPGRSGGLAISRSMHRPRKGEPGRAPPRAARPDVGWRPASRARPSGRHPAPEGWQRRGGRTGASPRWPGSRTRPRAWTRQRRLNLVGRPLPFRSAPRRPGGPPRRPAAPPPPARPVALPPARPVAPPSPMWWVAPPPAMRQDPPPTTPHPPPRQR
jgi:hypothetical protein